MSIHALSAWAESAPINDAVTVSVFERVRRSVEEILLGGRGPARPRIDRASPEYRKAFEAYLRYSETIHLGGGAGLKDKAGGVSEDRPTTRYIWRTRGTARCAFPARPMMAASSPGTILRPRAIRARTMAAAAGPSHMFRRSRPSPAPNSSSTSPCRTSLTKARLGQQGVAIRACLRALEGQCPVRGLVVSRGGRWWCPRPDSNQHALADNRF